MLVVSIKLCRSAKDVSGFASLRIASPLSSAFATLCRSFSGVRREQPGGYSTSIASYVQERRFSHRLHPVGHGTSHVDSSKVEGGSMEEGAQTPLMDAAWPDPTPSAYSMTAASYLSKKFGVPVDDISRLSRTEVAAVVCPRCEGDVVDAIAVASARGLSLSVRGTKHCMGGQALAEGGILLDMGGLNHVRYNADARTITAGAGATWAEVIEVANQHGAAPVTLQSYCSFSLGGSLAVNAHGISSDDCLASSILRLTVVTADGAVHRNVTRDGPDAQLWRHVVGGFGLFGVVTEVEVSLVDNCRLTADTVSVPVAALPSIYEGLIQGDAAPADSSAARAVGSGGAGAGAGAVGLLSHDAAGPSPPRPHVEVKLARLDITTLVTADMFLFSRAAPGSTVSALTPRPREMSPVGRLLYKWLAGPGASVRAAIERATGKAADWDVADTDRNALLFESAAPLAQLYSPLTVLDDTFILQEYFVPRAAFGAFVLGCRHPVLELLPKEPDVSLLNITVRVVRQDALTALPYAAAPGGVFAFVFYYRLRRTLAADAVLARYHDMLASLALRLKGTFYLPYRLHYSVAQLLQAYPSWPAFVAAKQAMDPRGVFSNAWWTQYRGAGGAYTAPAAAAAGSSAGAGAALMPLADAKHAPTLLGWPALAAGIDLPSRKACRSDGRAVIIDAKVEVDDGSVAVAAGSASDVEETQAAAGVAAGPPSVPVLPALHATVAAPRKNSLRRLLADPLARSRFQGCFLELVFTCAPADVAMRALASAAWDPTLQDDGSIYGVMAKAMAARASGAVGQVSQGVRTLYNLAAQKREVARQVVSLVGRLGGPAVAAGGTPLRSLACQGDHGRLLLPLRAALGLTGPAWLVHDSEGGPADAGAVLERGAPTLAEAGATLIRINYDALGPHPLRELASGSVDLYTVAGGLHHIPPPDLPALLLEIYRVLRPGGLLLVRDHDLSGGDPQQPHGAALLPTVDAAHIVFNAVTGVSPAAEASEVRTFRSLLDWRAVGEAAGLVDCRVYESQPGDPTRNVMMAFQKPPMESAGGHAASVAVAAQAADIDHREPVTVLLPTTCMVAPAMTGPSAAARVALNALPGLTLEAGTDALSTIVAAIPKLQLAAQAAVLSLPEGGVRNVAADVLKSYVTPILDALSRIRPLAATARPVDGAQQDLLVPGEVFLLEGILRARAADASIERSAPEQAILDLLDRLNPRAASDAAAGCAGAGGGAVNHDAAGSLATGSASASTSAAVTAAEVDALLIEAVAAMPLLRQTQLLLAQSGLPPRAHAAAAALLAGLADPSERMSTIERICSLVDRRGWSAFAAGVRAALAAGIPPSLPAMCSPGNPWHVAALGFLGCPGLRMTFAQALGARALGLGDVVTVLEQAQAARARSNAAAAAAAAHEDGESTGEHDASAAAAVTARVALPAPSPASLAALHAVFPVCCYNGVAAGEMHGVLEVVSAELCERGALLSDVIHDVTDAVRDALNPATGTLNLEAVAWPSRSRLGAWSVQILFRAAPSGAPGPPVAAAVAAAMRPGAFPRIGGSSAINELVSSLRSDARGAASGSVASNAGGTVSDAAHLWKLPEWLQVEIAEGLGNSLQHVPWYRWPLGAVASAYGSALKGTAASAIERHGLQGALTNSGFLTAAVPAVVGGLLGLQLAALALPLRLVNGDAYGRTPQEELLLAAPGGIEWRGLHRGLAHVGAPAPGLALLVSPSYRELSSVLSAIARAVPIATLLAVSGHTRVMVRVALPPPGPTPPGSPTAGGAGADSPSARGAGASSAAEAELAGQHGVSVLYHFPMPAFMPRTAEGEGVGAPARLHVAALVDTEALLSLLRLSERRSWHCHVFDFQ